MISSNRNPESLEDLFTAHYRALCQLSFSIVKNMDAAKDIVQDFFVKYWENLSGKDAHIRFEAYAYVAVRNRSYNYLDSVETRQRHMKQLMHNISESDLPTAEKETDTGEDYQVRLVKAIDKLPGQQRKIFLLSAVEGLKYSQVSEKLGISVNTVKTQMKRAYLSIRKDCDITILMLFLMAMQFMLSPFGHVWLLI